MSKKCFIQFWIVTGYEKDVMRVIFTPIANKLVASDLEIDQWKLNDLLSQWINLGKPKQRTLLKISDKKYLHILYSPGVYYLDGSISLSRPWGNHYRGIGKYHYVFSVEPIFEEVKK